MKHLLFTLLLMASGTQIACSKSTKELPAAIPAQAAPPHYETKGNNYMNDPQYIESYTLTAQDKQQLVRVIQTTVKVITQQMTLEAATPVLGEGEFFYPKADTPIRVYNFNRGKWVGGGLEWGGSFKRKDEQNPFFQARLSPDSLAQTTLTDFEETYFIKGLGLQFIELRTIDKMSLEELRSHSTNPKNEMDRTREELTEGSNFRYAEYHYQLIVSGQKLKFIFYVDKTHFNPKETQFPKNFRDIEIINETLQDPRVQKQMNRTVKFGDICPATGFWHCKEVTDERGIYLLKGDPMPGQSYRPEQREAMEWRLIKPVGES